MRYLCESLLKEWCETLLKLQIRNTENPRLDGAILCPACGRIHGRCFEAMYPFLHLAASEKDRKWIVAAEQLFIWADHTLSQADGSFFNDIDSDWKGTTVFNTIQLADCLLLHGDILQEETKQIWTTRLRHAAEFLYAFEELNENNINYPISNSLALHECGMVLQDVRYIQKAQSLVWLAEAAITENGLLIGEGIPHFEKSQNGCYPVDIGYNVEETLPSLALYGKLAGDTKVLDLAEKGLNTQLNFMLENGAWDNSFGTRNYKWTYWGSRTSDGCALGYLLFSEKHPEFALAAKRNLMLLKMCTSQGLLMGGPHYHFANQPACVHHTFTHAKVLAGILDRKLYTEKKAEENLPRQKAFGKWYYPEVKSWLVNLQSMTATITAYDWEYLKGGHTSGGTLSLLHHTQAGTLLCAGVNQYSLKEPNNMQIACNVKHECLALRIENWLDGILYSSLYESNAQVTVGDNCIIVKGSLKDINHKDAPKKDFLYGFCYQFEENKLVVQAKFTDGMLICPLISQGDESVVLDETKKSIRIQKEYATVRFETTGQIDMPYGTERIFNLVPGLQALRVNLEPKMGGLEIKLEVCEEAP